MRAIDKVWTNMRSLIITFNKPNYIFTEDFMLKLSQELDCQYKMDLFKINKEAITVSMPVGKKYKPKRIQEAIKNTLHQTKNGPVDNISFSTTLK
jgi:hypothetical protein